MCEEVKHIYEIDLIEKVNQTLNDIYDDISHLDKYPLPVSKKVLGILIQNACLGQNCGPIELGRKKIREINNRDWLIKYFIEVANVRGT